LLCQDRLLALNQRGLDAAYSTRVYHFLYLSNFKIQI